MALFSQTNSRLAGTESRRLAALPASALLVDALIMLAVGLVAIVGRRELEVFESAAEVEGQLTVAGPLILAAWLGVLVLFGAYRRDLFGAGTDEYKRVLNGSLAAASLAGVGCYLAKFPLSRGFFLLAFFLGIPTLILGRWLLRRTLHTARRRGSLRQRAVIVGTRVHVDEIAVILRRESWLGYEVVGALTPEYELAEETRAGIPVLGNTDDVAASVRAANASVIFFAGGSVGSSNQFRRSVWELERDNVSVIVAPSVTDISSERMTVRPVGGLPLIHIDAPTWADASRWGKRLFDIAGSVALLVLFSPLFMFTAIRIKFHDGGSVLFLQTRIGRNGEEFRCLKFRTMCEDAEDRLPALYVETQHSGGLFKLEDDPRVTAPGRWLRRFSVDELPQLVNVVKGDMSLVGPRPPLPAEVASYDMDTTRRLHVRPGMTGLWQVSGRSDLTWEETVRLDLYYVDNWSMLQDLVILSRTFNAVLNSRGAY